MEMEFCDIRNWRREKTGAVKERDGVWHEDEFFVIVHACIFNGKGELLIQQRSAAKHKWTNLWDLSVGGAVSAGEDSATSVSRELEEELGLAVDCEKVRPHMTVNFRRGFDDIYIFNMDLELDALRLQEEEVQAVRWASLNEVNRLIDCGEFIPYRKSFIALIFEVKDSMSMLSGERGAHA